MDRFNEYWNLLSNRNIKIGKELISYYKAINNENDENSTLSNECKEFLLENLRVKPYPTCQILRMLKNCPIFEFCEISVSELIKDSSKEHMCNILCNLPIPNEGNNEIFLKIREKVRANVVDEETVELLFLARKNLKILQKYLKWDKLEIQRKLLMNAIDYKTHWILDLAEKSDSFDDKELINCIRVIYAIVLINLDKFDLLSVLVQGTIESSMLTQTMLEYFYEIKRNLNVFQLISDRKVNFNEFPKHRGVLNKLIIENVSINLSNYELVRAICLENKENERDIIVLDQFLVLKFFIDAIFLDPSMDSYENEIEKKLIKIKTILRGFDNVTSYLELIEFFYLIIFLRNDHFVPSHHIAIEMGSETCLSSKISNTRRLSRRSIERTQGFICNQFLLDKILNLLKLSMTQKKHSLNFGEADDDLKVRFSRLVDYINDGLFRLNLLTSDSKISNEQPVAKRKYFQEISYSKIIIPHENNEKGKNSSSDLEERESDIRSDEEKITFSSKYSTFTQRKGRRKKRKLIKSSSENTTTGSETTTTVILDVLKKSSSPEIQENLEKYEKNIIVKMLGTPETFSTVFMIREDIDAVQKIIKTYKLENTQLASDISFLGRFQQIKEKLTELIQIYKSKLVDFKSECSQIDNIKNLTAIGFETSKILNVIENFVTSNKIQQNDSVLAMLNKYKKNYPFLGLFMPERIHIINIIDLMLSLPTGYDLNLNIYNMIMKFLEKSGDLDVDTKNEGYLRLIKNLVDALYHYKTIMNREITITDLLTKEIYSLTSNELSVKLERLKLFREFNEGERGIEQIDYVNDYFPTDVNYFQRILKMVENISKLMENCEEIKRKISIGEILKLDIEEILIDQIFVKNISAENLEKAALSVNTNLVYIVTKNSNKYKMTDEILDFVVQRNYLVAFLVNFFQNLSTEISYGKNLLENLSKIDGNFMDTTLKCDNLEFERTEDLEQLEVFSDLYVKTNKSQMLELRDELVLQKLNENNVEQISDINLRTRKIIGLFQAIDFPDKVQVLIKDVLLSSNNEGYELEKSNRRILENWLYKINIYRKIMETLNLQSWLGVKNLSETNPQMILRDLLEAKRYILCSEWIEIHPILQPTNEILDSFTYTILREVDSSNILTNIIEKMPKNKVIELYEIALPGVKSLKVLNYILDYLIANGQSQQKYQKFQISSKIFGVLKEEERKKSWNLLSRPILIIEQYLMNSKLEILAKMLSALRPFLRNDDCDVCGSVREYMMEIRATTSINLDSNHKDVFLTNECLDCLLRIYAAKALDFRIVTDSHGSTDMISNSDLSSLDSLYEPFKMPKEAPDKSKWVKDDECNLCMSCRRSVFTMLTRRHHCRRCGRIICYSCSTKRMKIPELYGDVLVRICDDCFNQTENNRYCVENSSEMRKNEHSATTENGQDEWKLSGNIRHDNFVRDEFGYEYAPSVSLCLSICKFHSANQECANFLLYHCGKLESLIRPIQPGYPNPEIDYTLVARMLHCLSIAAKVRNGSSECDIVKDHAEIILAVVQNRCEALLPQEPLNSVSLRRLKDSLVKMEKYALALELSLKCGFSASGVMAAWGISCLRAGSYETAREKFSHCMQKISTEEENSMLISYIESESTLNLDNLKEVKFIKRPTKSPPLLSEIIQILEATSQPLPEVLARASVILSSNTSLSSSSNKSMTKKDNIPFHEPALNILNTLSSLKQISNGVYNDFIPERHSSLIQMSESRISITSCHDYMKKAECINNTRYFEESMYYLTTYGNNFDTLVFLMKHQQVVPALKYTLLQKVDPDVFTNLIILPHLKIGELEAIIKLMVDFDDTLLIWKEYIVQICRFLEVKGMLNSLYHMQTLLKDPIRASMTCVRFYSMNCRTFSDLHAHSHHLENAQKHLESELELCNWEEINVADGGKSSSQKSLLMKMDLKTLNSHINTILRQMEVSKFLANCESCGRETIPLLCKLFIEAPKLPTLFGSLQEKMQLAVLTLVCGHNIEEGFGLSFRIIQDFNLDIVKVYGITAKYLCTCSRFQDVEKLLMCVGENSVDDSQAFSDEIICLSVKTAVGVHGITPSIKSPLDSLIKKIKDVGLKIGCHIQCGQLKAGYLLAVQHNRINDVRKILRQAEASNQVHIKRLCEKKLSQKEK